MVLVVELIIWVIAIVYAVITFYRINKSKKERNEALKKEVDAMAEALKASELPKNDFEQTKESVEKLPVISDNEISILESVFDLYKDGRNLYRSNKKYKKEVEEFQESNSNIIQLKQENETLKEKADKLDAYLQGEKAELVHSLAGDNEALMKEYEDIPVEHLRVFKKNMSNITPPKGVSPTQIDVDDGDRIVNDDDEDIYTDEMFEADFEASGL